ncbi:MAG: hypothetical protein LBP59_06225 [Planctomycetaceae bacterium]|nr:hypothetical protein [Planctomycetaceae bacterium]
MTNKNLIVVILAMMISFVLVDSVTAQPLRRLIRRILDVDETEAYRAGQQPNEQTKPNQLGREIDDRRILERAMKTINLFANNGQELKPVVSFSLASFDDYKKTIRTVAEKIRQEHNNNETPVIFDGLLNLYEKFINKHFDSKQPFGLILQTDGILYYPLVFMPLNPNSSIIQQLGNEYVEKINDDRYAIKQDKIKWPLGRLYVQQHNGWIFIATEFQLDSLPDNPSSLLPKLDENVNLLTARFDLANVPKLATRAALTLAEVDAVSKAETTVEKATAKLSIGHIRTLAEQADFLQYDLAYDEKNNNYIIREIEIAKPNTEQAKLLQQRRNNASPFHAFYMPENAILASHLAFNMTKLQSEQYEIILDELIGKHILTTQERQELKSKKIKQKQNKNQNLNQNLNQKITQPDQRDRLTELLKLSQNENNINNDKNDNDKNLSPEKLAIENNVNNNVDNNIDNNIAKNIDDVYLPDFPLVGGDVKNELGTKLSDRRKLEIMIRRIGVCYYWGLLGSIRSGKFDVATTWSDDYGIIGAFKIAEGERFQNAFDLMFEDMAKEFPDVYTANVRKDYKQVCGFKLTSVTVKLADLIKESPIGFFVTKNNSGKNNNNRVDNGGDNGGENGINILLAVRGDAVCYSICPAADRKKQERQLEIAIEGTEKKLPVYDVFFVFSAYELGKTYAKSGNPNQFPKLKSIAANASPNAVVQAKTNFDNNSKIITIKASALLTPSIWRLRENLKSL